MNGNFVKDVHCEFLDFVLVFFFFFITNSLSKRETPQTHNYSVEFFSLLRDLDKFPSEVIFNIETTGK